MKLLKHLTPETADRLESDSSAHGGTSEALAINPHLSRLRRLVAALAKAKRELEARAWKRDG